MSKEGNKGSNDGSKDDEGKSAEAAKKEKLTPGCGRLNASSIAISERIKIVTPGGEGFKVSETCYSSDPGRCITLSSSWSPSIKFTLFPRRSSRLVRHLRGGGGRRQEPVLGLARLQRQNARAQR